MMSRLDPLLEELIAATMAMTLLGLIVALLFWLVADISPWPGLVLGEVAGFGFGIVLLTLTSPGRTRMNK